MLQLTNWAFSMLKVLPERALEELNSDWTCSMALAERLQQVHAVPFRVGHHFASDIVTLARDKGYLPTTFPYAKAVEIYSDVTKQLGWQDGALPLTEAQFYQTLTPEYVVSTLQGAGSPAPQSVEEGLKQIEKRLSEDQFWLSGKRDSLKSKDALLDSLFETLTK